jgi:hypothetical protein
MQRQEILLNSLVDHGRANSARVLRNGCPLRKNKKDMKKIKQLLGSCPAGSKLPESVPAGPIEPLPCRTARSVHH